MKFFFKKRPSISSEKKYLIITTSGGGGHLQAAKAKKEEICQTNPNAYFIEKNIVETAGGKYLGKFMIDWIWNTAQRKGSVKALDLCAYSIPLFDILFWIPVFFQILNLLFQEGVDEVIDTQPMSTSSIISATYLYSKLTKKRVLVHKILTELPTHYSSHYLKPIKKLSSKKRELIKLITTKPLLSENESEQTFWEMLAKLSSTQIVYDQLPIRSSFKNVLINPQSCLNLRFAFKNEEEKTLLCKALSLSNYKVDGQILDLKLESDDHVTTIMLGSQPMQEATLDYVKNFIELVKTYNHKQNFYLFIFCSDKKYEPIPLQKRIFSMIESFENFPSNLIVVPMSSQTDEVIAPLYGKSIATITKAGGITSMELLVASKGKIWIHHEIPDALNTKGMPRWEYGNALYLQKIKGASLTTPKTFFNDFSLTI